MKLIITLTFGLLLLACNDQDNTPERIDKLRAIGLQPDLAAYTYSTADTTQAANLTFYLLTNNKTDGIGIESAAVENEKSQLTLSHVSTAEEDLAELRLYTITFSTNLPTAEQVTVDQDGSAAVAYGMRFIQGLEDEKADHLVLCR